MYYHLNASSMAMTSTLHPHFQHALGQQGVRSLPLSLSYSSGRLYSTSFLREVADFLYGLVIIVAGRIPSAPLASHVVLILSYAGF